VTSGRDQGAYYHNLFLRGRPDWVKHIRRQKVKNSVPPRQFKLAIKLEGKDNRHIESPPTNFYEMEFCFYSSVSRLDFMAADNPASDTDMMVDLAEETPSGFNVEQQQLQLQLQQAAAAWT
jgi:hypothetical protein